MLNFFPLCRATLSRYGEKYTPNGVMMSTPNRVFMKKVFERLLELKKEQSVAAFARSISIPQQNMDRYLKGREPPIDVIVQLCLVYKVSSDWLLGLSDNYSTAVEQLPSPPAHPPSEATADVRVDGVSIGRDCLECPLLQAHLKRFSRPRK